MVTEITLGLFSSKILVKTAILLKIISSCSSILYHSFIKNLNNGKWRQICLILMIFLSYPWSEMTEKAPVFDCHWCLNEKFRLFRLYHRNYTLTLTRYRLLSWGSKDYSQLFYFSFDILTRMKWSPCFLFGFCSICANRERIESL